MLPQIPYKVKLNDEYICQKIEIGNAYKAESNRKMIKPKSVKQKTNNKNLNIRTHRQDSGQQNRDQNQSQNNFNFTQTNNQNFKVNVDINSRNVLIHVPDYVGREKIQTEQMEITSRFTDEIKILNKMIFKEQERIMTCTQIDYPAKKADFMTEVPEQRAQTNGYEEQEQEQSQIKPKKTKLQKNRLTIGGEKNRVPKFGQRANSKQEHIQRVLSRENTQINTPNLVPTLSIKKHPLQNYLNAYLSSYKPFLKGERDNLPQILKNIINNIQQPNISQQQNNEILNSQKFQELEDNITNIFVKQQVQQ